VKAQGAMARLVSPAPLALARGSVDRLVLGVDAQALIRIGIDVRDATGGWMAAGPPIDAGSWQVDPAGLVVPFRWPAGLTGIEALRISLTPRAAGEKMTLRHIALYPAPAGVARAAPVTSPLLSETAAR
jgi:hypothetical protein